MTTAEFIKQTYNTTNEKYGKHGYDRRCSSVVTDKKGIVYSYGRHYPLAFHVRGLDFVNNAGYSNTTNKHINWAQSAIGYGKYINVKLWKAEAQVIESSWASSSEKLAAINTALYREINTIKEIMSTKKRKDTQVYADLLRQHEQLTQSIFKVYEASK